MSSAAWQKRLAQIFSIDRRAHRALARRPELETLEPRWLPSITATGQNLTFTENAAQTVTVATFTDTTPSPAADYAATIVWGDGITTGGSVSGASGGPFTVTDSHTYAEDTPATAALPITVTIVETNATDVDTATATGSAAVAEASLTGVSGVPLTGTELQSVSGTIALFSDSGSTDDSTAFAAQINWGDGTSGAGTVTGTAGNYTVSGIHRYADEGTFTATATLIETGVSGATASATDTALIAEADGLAPGSAQPTFTAVEGQSSSGAVAVFTDSAAQTAGDFTAQINWGDGTSSAGTVTGSPAGGVSPFTVSGSHTYAAEGTFAPTVILTEDAPGTAAATATGAATVSDVPVQIYGGYLLGTEGLASGNQTVAYFTDPGGADPLSDVNGTHYAASIAWGDGTSSAGTITYNAQTQVFSVQGSHTYAEEGFRPISVTVTHDTAPASTGAGLANIGDAPLAITSLNPPAQAQYGVAFTGAVAYFADVNPHALASDFKVLIDWGDTLTTPGTVAAIGHDQYGNSLFAVYSTHTYYSPAPYAFGVTVADVGGASAAAATPGSAVAVNIPPSLNQIGMYYYNDPTTGTTHVYYYYY